MTYFIGDTPSRLNTDPKVAFKGAKCEMRLNEWIKFVLPKDEIYKVFNSTDDYFAIYCLWAVDDGYHIIALGNNASKALGIIPHFKLPHLSGRNRQLNDKQFILDKLEECRQYLN